VIASHPETVPSFYRIRFQADPRIGYRREVRRRVAAALDRGERGIVVDCSSWSDLDLILLSALVDCATICEERGADFELENLTNELRARIEALHLGDRLHLTV
jgi:anti-anti-sigma regulatory factor